MKKTILALIPAAFISVSTVTLLPSLAFAVMGNFGGLANSPALKQKNPLFVPIVLNSTSAKINTSDVSALADKLSQRFTEVLKPLQAPAPSCDSDKSYDYISVLTMTGQFQKCLDYAISCSEDSHLNTPLIFHVARECADKLPGKDEKFWEKLAADSRFENHEDQMANILKLYNIALSKGDEGALASLMGKAPSLSASEKKMWDGLLRQALGMNVPKELTKKILNQFLDQQMALTRNSRVLDTLRTIWISNALTDDRHGDVVLKFSDWISTTTRLDTLAASAYHSAYIALDQKFGAAKKIYDAVLPYMNSTWSLPNELNTLNYTQIQSVCSEKLTKPGPEQKAYKNIKSNLRNNRISPEQALKDVSKLLQAQPHRADLLTVQGSLFSILGRSSEAINSFWRAHLECPYYNRAHWGIYLELRARTQEKNPHYQNNEDRVLSLYSKLKRPSSQVLNSYFFNWDITSSEINKKKILVSARIWLPYLSQLSKSQYRAYLKPPFEILSEAPGYQHLADIRVSGANDNRLWDDVRGAGGNVVVADLIESLQSTHGSYNLLAHEMAHQFHYYVRQAEPRLGACIRDLYNEAKKLKKFPEAYAGSNEYEYFAQGVSYYLIPEEAPSNFGLNRQWYRQNDPQLLKFIKSIDEAQGNLRNIECPLH